MATTKPPLHGDAGATAAECWKRRARKYPRAGEGPKCRAGHHELDTRHGERSEESVLNAFNQAHDVKNVFVMDGASFVSSACQKPDAHDDGRDRPRMRSLDWTVFRRSEI